MSGCHFSDNHSTSCFRRKEVNLNQYFCFYLLIVFLIYILENLF